MLEKHGCPVKEEQKKKLKSELYYSSTHSAQLTAEPVHPIPALTIVGGLI